MNEPIAARTNVTSGSSNLTSNALSAKDFHSENGDIKLNRKLSDKAVDVGNSSSENVADVVTLPVPVVHHQIKHKKPHVKKTKYQDFDASLVKDEGILSSIMKVFGLNQCPATPPDLNGPIEVDTQPEFLENVEKRFADKITLGGRFKPSDCRARDRVAVVIPFRDRKQHLPILLKNLHSFLMRQQIDYGIFLVEQSADGSFNRAKLMNVGYVEALKLYEWDCFVFHDVDLLPMDDRNLYTCPDQPRHMSVAVDTFGFK
jgi:N-terminal region of glycosyl transferase group 7